MKLLYITNEIDEATVVDSIGIDFLFLDLEKIGKKERQNKINAHFANHSIDDLIKLNIEKFKIKKLVRVNPIHESTFEEVESVINAGADRIMLPMFRSVDEIEYFNSIVNRRLPVTYLVETNDALNSMNEWVKILNIKSDEIYFGLNDLSLSMGMKHIFEILTNEYLTKFTNMLKEKNINFGIGGIGLIGKGDILADKLITEYFRLGSTRVILSRSFRSCYDKTNLVKSVNLMENEVKKLRKYIETLKHFTSKQFDDNLTSLKIDMSILLNGLIKN